MQDISPQTIFAALDAAGVTGFTGNIVALGGGEINNTYKLNFEHKQLILRVAKDMGQETLKNEARALSLLDSPHIPKLVYFDGNSRIDQRLWILESYLPGSLVKRMSPQQLNRLGSLLACVHQVRPVKEKIKLKQQFIDSCKTFGDEQFLLNHPNETLRRLIRRAFDEFNRLQLTYDKVEATLIHADATPSNVLVDGDEVGLIDWEFSRLSDPMCDFSTIYYEDIEYNRGKWRIKITDTEKRALFDGYTSAGGNIDNERIKFWIRFDKLGAVVFLYWRINQSQRITEPLVMEQYKFDFANLVESLNSSEV